MSGAKFIFQIYDLEAKDRMDCFYLGDALRSLDLIPINSLVQKMGGMEQKGQNYLTIEEFLPIVHQVSNMKDMGNLEVFIECLRLYDRHENGLMLAADLRKVLGDMGNLEWKQKLDLN